MPSEPRQVETVMAVPPAKIFENAGQLDRENPSELIANQKQTGYILDPEKGDGGIVYPEEGGILAFHIGVPFPEKGFPEDDATFALNGLKRMTIGPLRAIMSKDNWLPALGFLLMSKKAKIRSLSKFMQAYVDGAWWWVGPFIWKRQYLSTFGRALYTFIYNVTTAFGIPADIAERFAHLIAYMVDYDNSYRLQAEDLFSETTKELLLKHLRREIKRLLELYAVRQTQPGQMADKFRAVSSLVSMLALIPSFRKAIKVGIEKSEFKNFQYDDADSYHILLRDDYNHKGYTAQQRRTQYVGIHRGNFPPRIMQNQ